MKNNEENSEKQPGVKLTPKKLINETQVEAMRAGLAIRQEAEDWLKAGAYGDVHKRATNFSPALGSESIAAFKSHQRKKKKKKKKTLKGKIPN
ncbi:hypothetical protein EYF80_039399 [Liparis tanakae]|uniref:Uncharacterized protein n=1 Tax=Liparis tanakae TaxID=230148 RepID=A0A4Z2GCQ1_9TELE|nr:hypothetical protein EYF80_039399 [Liparis tanakae]